MIAIHLHLAVIGCLTLLIVAVGRTLVPMLAVAPVAPRRRWPSEEIAIAIGLWLSVSGFAFGQRWPVVLGTLVTLAAVTRFFALVVRAARTRRVPSLEGPLLHALAGLGFLVQAGVLATLILGHPLDPRTLAAYVVSLVVGWASGVTLGHVGKLLAVSAWTWWPPGPRPKQAAFYDRLSWTAEVIVFSLACELLVVGALVEAVAVVRAGAVLLVLSALLALRGAHSTIALMSSPKVGPQSSGAPDVRR